MENSPTEALHQAQHQEIQQEVDVQSLSVPPPFGAQAMGPQKPGQGQDQQPTRAISSDRPGQGNQSSVVDQTTRTTPRRQAQLKEKPPPTPLQKQDVQTKMV